MEYCRTFLDKNAITRKETAALKGERLRFRGGQNLGDVAWQTARGKTRRKIRRIIEKRVSQTLLSGRNIYPRSANHIRHLERLRTSDQIHSIYGFTDIG